MLQAMAHLADQIDRLAAMLDECVTLTRAGVPISGRLSSCVQSSTADLRKANAVTVMMSLVSSVPGVPFLMKSSKTGFVSLERSLIQVLLHGSQTTSLSDLEAALDMSG
jgi:hypothetical protein